MSVQNFKSQRAIEVMDLVCDFLKEHGRATSADIAASIGMTQIHAANYMVHMEKLDRIHCVERPRHIQGGRTPTVWALGPAPADGDDVDAAGRKGFVRLVAVHTKWPPNHVRMPMECLLFGVPKILQGIHA